VAKLITIEPEGRDGDFIITAEKMLHSIGNNETEGLIIRTIPNGEEKLTKKYSGSNPPYFQPEALELAKKRGVKHLLVDLPSVDKEEDGGRLSAHKKFWDYPSNPRIGATITELIYVPESVSDGIYLVNLQIISLETDACPSKPVLYALG